MARIRATGDGVHADGIAKLNRDLKAISKDAQQELKKANIEVAEKVGDHARAAASAHGSTLGHIAPSIKGGGGTTWAGIKFGSGYPMAMGAEFGGQGRPTTMQFEPHLGTTGYAIFPTIRRDNHFITNEWTEAITDLMRKHGL